MTQKTAQNKELKLSRHLIYSWSKRAADRNNAAMAFGTKDGTVMLTHDGARGFRNAVELLAQTEEIRDRVSEKIIEALVREELSDLCQSPKRNIESRARESASRLITRLLEYPTQVCGVIFPVYGLELFPTRLVVELGDVIIYCLHGALEQREFEKWESWIDSAALTDTFSEGMANKYPLAGTNYWATATVQANPADQDRMYLEGKRLVEGALAMLALFQFAIPKTDHRKSTYRAFPIVLSLKNIESREYSRFVIEHGHDSSYEAFPVKGVKWKTCSYEISDDLIEAFNQEGFGAWCVLMRNPVEYAIHERIRRALEYVYLGMQAENPFQKYVMYVAGLEAVLLKQNERRGTRRILSQRASHLMESNSEKRKRLFSLVEKLYDIRCDIVHGEPPKTSLVDEATDYLRWVLYATVKRLVTGQERFRSVDEVAAWVKRQEQGEPLAQVLRSILSRICNRLSTKIHGLYAYLMWLGGGLGSLC